MKKNHRFRSLQLAELAEKEETKKEANRDNNTLTVYEIGETRTINFILKDGTQQNFPYSHYLTAWLGKEDNDRVIKIFFATHLVTIYGLCLKEIYNGLVGQSLELVTALDKRYLKEMEEGSPFVEQIKITWRSKNDN